MSEHLLIRERLLLMPAAQLLSDSATIRLGW